MTNITAENFASATVKSFESDFGIFANKVNVENWVPESASDIEKSLFLFYVVQLDYATKSQKLYEGATLLLKDKQSFFDPVFKTTISK